MSRKTALTAITILALAQIVPIATVHAGELRSAVKSTSAATQFQAAPRTTHGTCNSSGFMGCDLDEFVAGCGPQDDKSSGGLSTEPGGGVSCEFAETK